jgi:hypothetical protein
VTLERTSDFRRFYGIDLACYRFARCSLPRTNDRQGSSSLRFLSHHLTDCGAQRERRSTTQPLAIPCLTRSPLRLVAQTTGRVAILTLPPSTNSHKSALAACLHTIRRGGFCLPKVQIVVIVFGRSLQTLPLEAPALRCCVVTTICQYACLRYRSSALFILCFILLLPHIFMLQASEHCYYTPESYKSYSIHITRRF